MHKHPRILRPVELINNNEQWAIHAFDKIQIRRICIVYDINQIDVLCVFCVHTQARTHQFIDIHYTVERVLGIQTTWKKGAKEGRRREEEERLKMETLVTRWENLL